ncbi:MAG: amidohydrolase [Candidatus Tectomicrobia bacterium]|nr:amidohydrolase [Candidatus Tectomicrobia bacterium]
MVDKMKKTLFDWVEDHKVYLGKIGDAVFSYGELGMQEIRTSQVLKDAFRAHGFNVQEGISGIPTAFLATYGEGKPIVAFLEEFDGLPNTSQKPGVPKYDPIVEGAPGHGEGHNTNAATLVGTALALKEVMEKYRLPGTIKAFGVPAEEQLVCRPFFVRDGYLDDVDFAVDGHIRAGFGTSYGLKSTGLISAEFTFYGKTAHAGAAPWLGASALDAVQLMNIGYEFLREHLRPTHRVHHVTSYGGDQPNVVPAKASTWYFFREQEAEAIRNLYEKAKRVAAGAAMMTGTEVQERILSAVWPVRANKLLAEIAYENIQQVGMPKWSREEQSLAKALQKEMKLDPVGIPEEISPLTQATQGGGSSDIGDVTWVVPYARIDFPTQPAGIPFHHWSAGVCVATSMAHKGIAAGSKAIAATALDVLTQPQLLARVKQSFKRETAKTKYVPLLPKDTPPPIHLNKDIMEKYRPEMEKYYYDPQSKRSYLEEVWKKG